MKKEIIFGLFVALFLAIIVSPFASPWPDGLERVAGESETHPILPAIIPDYVFPGIKNEKIATSIAGMFGALIVFLIPFGLFKRKR